MKNSAEKERWEDIAQAAAKKNSGRCKLECEKCDAKFTKIILSAIAESHQSKTEQPEPELEAAFREAVEILGEKEAETESVKAQTQNALLPCPFCGKEAILRLPQLAWCRNSVCAIYWHAMTVTQWNKRAVLSVEQGNDAGAALLSKESEVASLATDKEFGTLIGELVGMASMCWIPTPTGVFDSTRAISVMDGILSASNRRVASLQRKLEESQAREIDHCRRADTAEQAVGDNCFEIARLRDVIDELRKALIKARDEVAHSEDNPPDFLGTGSDSKWAEQQGKEFLNDIKETLLVIDAALALSSPVPTEAAKL